MKVIAYFLPQFHHTPENDLYWGKGFTEWDNVRSSKKYFENHRMPIKPSELGYYDLSKKRNIKLISDYAIGKGVDGFGYWHYWFGNGRQTLEKVPEIHFSDQSNMQNYFFAWANTSWTKSWHGDDKTIIFNQEYSKESALKHYEYLRKFFNDKRYINIKSKPVFQVINPNQNGTIRHVEILEELAIKEFGQGLHWLFPVDANTFNYKDFEYSLVGYPPGGYISENIILKIKKKLISMGILKGPLYISQKEYLSLFKSLLIKQLKNQKFLPCLLAGWDNTPRYKTKGFLIDSKISTLLKKQFDILYDCIPKEKRIDLIFIKAWNEWAEGNILEPHIIHGEEDNPGLVITDYKKVLIDKYNINA